MDTLSFLINFISCLRVNKVIRFSKESLDIFFNSYINDKSFKEKFPLFNESEIDSSFEMVIQFNLLKKKLFREKYLIVLSEDASNKILSNLSEEELKTMFLYVLRYISFMAKLEECYPSYEVRYSIINEQFVNDKYDEQIKLIKKYHNE